MITWLVGNVFIRKQSLSYPGIIRRKDVNSGRQHEDERVAVGTIAPNGPDFQVLCPSLLTALSLKAEGVTYWAGSGGTLANKSLQWVKQGYFTGHRGIRFPALTYAAALCIFQVSGYGSSEVNIC